MTFRLGYVTGATPDKWARIWRERQRESIELVPLEEAGQEASLRAGELDMALVRLPIDRDGLHCIPLYEEQPVVVLGTEHVLTLADEVTLDDLAGEQLVLPERSGWTPSVAQREWPAMSEREAVEVAASGSGVVIVPMSIARLHHRKDATHRPVAGLPATTVGLAWPTGNEDPRLQTFIGIVRGRTANSSRG